MAEFLLIRAVQHDILVFDEVTKKFVFRKLTVVIDSDGSSSSARSLVEAFEDTRLLFVEIELRSTDAILFQQAGNEVVQVHESLPSALHVSDDSIGYFTLSSASLCNKSVKKFEELNSFSLIRSVSVIHSHDSRIRDSLRASAFGSSFGAFAK